MERKLTVVGVFLILSTTIWRSEVSCLKNLELRVPAAVLAGRPVVLECSCQLEDEEVLYSVKWYRGREEFYRYIPKELPHTRVFPLPGIEVDISRSGAWRVVLRRASAATAGRYRCEVSADAPTFHTELGHAHLDVIEPPARGPRLVSDRSWYGVGAALRAACAAPPARPPANLTFELNGVEVDPATYQHEAPAWLAPEELEGRAETTPGPPPPEDSFQYLDESYIDLHEEEIRRVPKEPVKQAAERAGPDARRATVAAVSLPVEAGSFRGGALRVACVARAGGEWSARAELVFDLEPPEVASVLGVRNRAAGRSRARLLLPLAAALLRR